MRIVKKITALLILQTILLGCMNFNLAANGSVPNSISSFNYENFKKTISEFIKLSKEDQIKYLKESLMPEQREVLQKSLENETLYRMLLKTVINGKIAQSFIWPGLGAVGFGAYKFVPCLFNQCTLESSKNILGGSGGLLLGFVLMAVSTKIVNHVMG